MKAYQILVLILLILLSLSPGQGPVQEAEAKKGEGEEVWNATITQSNESWKQVLNYTALDVFYQNRFLHIELDHDFLPEEVDDPDNITVEFIVASGSLALKEDTNEEFWAGWNFHQIEEYRDIRNQSRFLSVKPDEHDINFNMTLRFMVYNGSGEDIYNETHTFWIFGEPKVTVHEVPSNQALPEIYLTALIISLFLVIPIYALARVEIADLDSFSAQALQEDGEEKSPRMEKAPAKETPGSRKTKEQEERP